MTSHITRNTIFALVSTFFATLIIYSFYPRSFTAFDTAFDPILIKYYGMYDGREQSFLYRTYIILLTTIAFIAGLLKISYIETPQFNWLSKFLNWKTQNAQLVARIILTSLAISILLFVLSYAGLAQNRYIHRVAIVLLYVSAICGVMFAPIIPNRIIFVVCSVFCIVLVAPAFDSIHTAQLSLARQSISEYHFSAFIGTAYQLGADFNWLNDATPSYGFLPSFLIYITIASGFDVSLGTLVMLTSVFQIIGLAIVALLVFTVSKSISRDNDNDDTLRFSLASFLLLLIIVGPYFSSFNPAIFLPNQSVLRYLPMILYVLVLYSFRRKTSAIFTFMIGLFIGFEFLYSPELGLVCAMGTGFAWLVKQREEEFKNSPLKQILSVVFGFLSFIVAFYYVYWAALGTPILEPLSYFNFIFLFGSGFGGLRLELDLRVIWVLVHTSFIFVTSIIFIVSGSGQTSPYKAGLSAIILIWMTYYINRAADWNLWSICLAYAFLILPNFIHYWKRPLSIAIFALIFAVAPFGFLKSSVTGFYQKVAKRAEIVDCGYAGSLPLAECEILTEQLTELKSISAQNKNLLWFTVYPLTTLLTLGKSPPTNLIDQFIPNIFLSQQEDYVLMLKSLEIELVALDRHNHDGRHELFKKLLKKADYIPCQTPYKHWVTYKYTGC